MNRREDQHDKYPAEGSPRPRTTTQVRKKPKRAGNDGNIVTTSATDELPEAAKHLKEPPTSGSKHTRETQSA